MIDLSQFVGKKVRVTFRNGETNEGEIDFISKQNIYPYSFVYGGIKSARTKRGSFLSGSVSCIDIIKIEEIKPMSKYEELEKKVAEMQKEIDRLKKEEIVHPKIKSVRVTRTIDYSPAVYLMDCRVNGVYPSQKDFIDYLEQFFGDDFNSVPIYDTKIEEIDE